MEKALPKNRPSRAEFVFISRSQLEQIPEKDTNTKSTTGDDIAKILTGLLKDIASVADKTFVMMKNKRVWYDRNNAALFPKFDSGVLRAFNTYNQPARSYSLNFEGFYFEAMTEAEFIRSFIHGTCNPYLNADGNFRHLPVRKFNNSILTEEIHSTGQSHIMLSDGSERWWKDGDEITLIPIHRTEGKNAPAMSYPGALLYWVSRGLIPAGLSDKQENIYKTFIDDYPKLSKYISFDNSRIIFDSKRFNADVDSGAFSGKVLGLDFTKKKEPPAVVTGGKVRYKGSVDALKEELLNCDFKRANIQPYDERQLIDINRGHWELFETEGVEDAEKITLPPEASFVARPPQLDVSLNGICAIDFGTKSTVVVCRDGEARMLRIGKGDYSKAPTADDFQNPTVIAMDDLQGFLAAYRKRTGRPFTQWNQVKVSHQASEAIFKEGAGVTAYNSVFSELKQWAKDDTNPPTMQDTSGKLQEVKLYSETNSIDAGDFDPIELYAYYLGLYINNMHRQIYLDYILSYPVNYRKDVREHIRQSFERGIKKSLPPALLADEEMMKRFRVYLGASEPAAYAISALEGFKLEPKNTADKVAYGVFDFGGGTTDFDFGIEYVPANHRRNFIIEQFGFNGDALLGGENILELLAYEVYKDNLQEMRDKKIPFALPAGCKFFAGAETLVSRTKDSAAHMNNRILAEALRPIWENTDRSKLTEDALPLKLFAKESVSVTLKIDAEKLDRLIERRIREGVVNFFQSLRSAFEGKDVSPIHIFLAGNSCRSPLVKKIFDEFIASEDGEFILHMPLGFETPASDETLLALIDNIAEDVNKISSYNKTFLDDLKPLADHLSELTEAIDYYDKNLAKEAKILTDQADDMISVAKLPDSPQRDGKIASFYFATNDFITKAKEIIADDKKTAPAIDVMELDRQRTGKTGVAFGLIRCRRGGKDIKIINRNVDANDEMIFPYFLGDAGNDGNTFTVIIGREVGYGAWTYFTFADEPEFELYYTTEPRALKGDLPAAQVKMIHCILDDEDTSDDEDVGIYIRKVAPNQIEYAVGYEDDFKDNFDGKIYQQTL